MNTLKVGVVGASYAGLCSALALRCIGCEVSLFERSATPHRIGGGIVVQPEFSEYLEAHGYATQASAAVPTLRRKFLQADGAVAGTTADSVFYSAWDTLLESLRRQLTDQDVYQGVSLIELNQAHDRVEASFSDGQTRTFDLLIGADGLGSTVRAQVLPDVKAKYAGYVGYRGLIPESELSESVRELIDDSFVFYGYPRSHILNYLIPGEGGELSKGQRRYNWVWYLNTDEQADLPAVLTDSEGQRHRSSLGPGEMSESVRTRMRERADAELPAIMAEVVRQPEDPFVQGIFDLQAPQMCFDRILLLGDAACLVRPHTASGTSKAVGDAIALSDHLRDFENLGQALKAWEVERLAVANRISNYGLMIAARSGLGVS